MPNSALTPRSQLTRRIASDLARAVWRFRSQTVVSVLLMIAAKLSIVLMPLALKHIVDELDHLAESLLFPGFLLLAYALLRFVGDALNEARRSL